MVPELNLIFCTKSWVYGWYNRGGISLLLRVINLPQALDSCCCFYLVHLCVKEEKIPPANVWPLGEVLNAGLLPGRARPISADPTFSFQPEASRRRHGATHKPNLGFTITPDEGNTPM